MPVKRQYAAYPIRISDGGRFLPDLPVGSIGASNFDEKVNIESELEGVRLRAGWDYPANEDDWLGGGLANFHNSLPAEAIGTVRRPNGTYAIVGCGAGQIKYFDYDTNAWVGLATGYATRDQPGFRWWQIVDVAGYAVFNNGLNLPCEWQVGDSVVRPLFELREAGYASVGLITEYVDGVLMCADILEINDASHAAIMTGPDPYGTIVEGPTTTRISFRRVWSNVGDPRDFAVTVPGTVTASSTALTLAWPMQSFHAGDEIEIIGAGVEGGNHITTIQTISGVNVTLTDAAATSVVDADVQRPSDIDSIAGYDDIEDDGSAIVLQIPLKTQLITFKASGNIWQTYYTGDLDTPFAKDRVTKKPGVAPKYPRAVLNIVDDNENEYLLFPGGKHFYSYHLGSQAPKQHPAFKGAEKTLFFDRIKGLGPYEVWGAINACTDEAIFAYNWRDYESDYYNANRALAFKYEKDAESLSEISGWNFLCAITVEKPTAELTCDESELWFLMGDNDGKITRYGQSNLEVFTRQRYGENAEAILGGGLFAPGARDTGSYVRRFSLDPANPDSSAGVTVQIFGAVQPNKAPQLLESKTLTNPVFPGSMGLHYRKPFYKYRIVANTDADLRISGFTWRFAAAETNAIERLE